MMQNKPKPHIGLPEGAPLEVKWSNNSFLKPVEMFEEFNFKPYILTVYTCTIFLVAIGAVAVKWHELFFSTSETDKLNTWGLWIGLSGIAGIFLHGHLLKCIFILKVRRRQQRLFEPDWKSVLVFIEDFGTYDKKKLISDDFGLLCVHGGYIDIEMTSHRAHLAIKDVSVSKYKPANANTKITSVRLVYKADLWPWDIVLFAPSQSWNLLIGASYNKGAIWLLHKIQKDADSI